MSNTALAYLASGLSVLPARRNRKCPAVPSWKPYQSRLPSQAEVEAWFANRHDAMCVVTCGVSGNAEALDFDAAGAMFDDWVAIISKQAPGLLERLVIERSPSGGFHAVYRCVEAICGNLKLAQRLGANGRPQTLIETRGEGGLFLCAPTPGYALIQGSLTDLPILTAAERDILLSAAWSLNEYVPDVVDGPKNGQSLAHVAAGSGLPTTARPGDDFSARGDIREILIAHGWTLVRTGENEYWRRPGKTSGWSATLKNNVLFVFSSNAEPFEPGKGYSPFAVYAWLEHNGDFAAAAAKLREQGFGEDAPVDADVDLSGFCVGFDEVPEEKPVCQDPGPLPEHLLRVPGFIGEVMDYCLQTAPYPNLVMAFCGALSLQAFLAGRKVRDSGDNRTNLYLLGLAHSAAGKDWPRKVNTRVIHEIGMAECLGDRFASGEGMQDALFLTPCMLFQTDEIDGMLQAINKAKDARHESIMTTLLTMYSSANSVFPMRRKAGKEAAGVIDQPNLVIFGTAIPNHYYEALSERMLTNGFFARMMILEAGRRSEGQEPCIRDLPARVLATAKWWANYRPGTGNLQNWHPIPTIVEQTDDARRMLSEARQQADGEYAKAETAGDPVGTTVWGRVSEQVRKLALLHAISENHLAPKIGTAAVAWAVEFVMHQTRRMLYMAANHVAENPFHAECLKVTQKLREAPGQELPHQVLLKRMKVDAKHFRELIDTLAQRGEVEAVPVRTTGRSGLLYRLIEQVKEGE